DNARAERIAAAARLDDGGRWPRPRHAAGRPWRGFWGRECGRAGDDGAQQHDNAVRTGSYAAPPWTAPAPSADEEPVGAEPPGGIDGVRPARHAIMGGPCTQRTRPLQRRRASEDSQRVRTASGRTRYV